MARSQDKNKRFFIISEFKRDGVMTKGSAITESLLLAVMIFVFMLFIFTSEIIEFFYFQYSDELQFVIDGFTTDDIGFLQKIGFHDINIENGTAVLDSLDNIWFKKIIAVFRGKDIVSAFNEEMIELLFEVKLVFFVFGIALFALMLSLTSNSFYFKMNKSWKFNYILFAFGYDKKECRDVFMTCFMIKHLISAVISALPFYLIMRLFAYLLKKYLDFTFAFDGKFIHFLLIIYPVIILILILSDLYRWNKWSKEEYGFPN